MATVEQGDPNSSKAVLNTQEMLERLKRTEELFKSRSAARDALPPAPQGPQRTLKADTEPRQTKRIVNIGQQPLAESELKLAFERVLGTNDLVGMTFVERMLRAISATGRIVIRTPDGRGGFGTGFLIAPGVLLTNNHVLASESIASLSRVQFNYEERDGGVLVEPVEFQLRPDLFFLTNIALDYTFVGVADTNDQGAVLGRFGFVPLIESEGKIAVTEPMNIIQHPSGERKRLALRKNALLDVLADFVHYEADTSPGSSGSPVFSDLWEVVALHHSGVPKRNSNNRILSRAGDEWSPSMGEDAIAWIANEGVRVSRIIATLKTAAIRPTHESTRQTILTAPGIKQPSPFRFHEGQPTSAAMPVPAAGAPILNADGTATWIVPVTLTLGVLGLPAVAPQSVRPPAGPNPSTGTATGSSRPVPPSPPPAPVTRAASQEVAKALEEFEEARSQPYFDEAKDRQEKRDYYAALGNADRAPSADALSQHLERTHTTKVRYDSGRSVYVRAELHEDTQLRSIYSGVTFDPREAIKDVVELDEQIKAVEAKIAEGQFNESQGLEEINMLEAASAYNCEHVVPQSWFGRGEPMRGDMHHLFACGSRCNSFRGNTPYFDFPDFEEATMTDCGKREKMGERRTGFEPGRGKAIVARATLYFLLRYPKRLAQDSLPTDRIPILLAWHKSTKPNRYECHRNQAIFQKQGNRNPFIDFPDWADDIDFVRLLSGSNDTANEPRRGRGSRR